MRRSYYQYFLWLNRLESKIWLYVFLSIMGFLGLIVIGACTLDVERIERTRANMRFLCDDPETEVVRKWCEKLAADKSEPVKLTKPE